jgi:hypothetical protein
VTRYAPLWQQEGNYSADVDRSLFGALWPAGGASGAAPAKVAGTMTVNIPPGLVAVPLAPGQGSALCRWDSTEAVTLGPAPPSGQSRFDLIVCQVRDVVLDGGANNDFVFEVIAGAPATSLLLRPETHPGDTPDAKPGEPEGPEVEPFAAAPPATPANAYAMFTVLVPGGAANLDGATLADLRRTLGQVGGRPYGRLRQQGSFPSGAAPNAMITIGAAANANSWVVDYLRGGMKYDGAAGAKPGAWTVPVDGLYELRVELGNVNDGSNAVVTGGFGCYAQMPLGSWNKKAQQDFQADFPAIVATFQEWLNAGQQVFAGFKIGPASMYIDPNHGNAVPSLVTLRMVEPRP